MERRLQDEEAMKTMTPTIEIVRVDRFVVEVDVTLIETEGGWSPYLSLEDAQKVEAVELALKRGDVAAAQKLGRVYELTLVAAE
jgi:hypothetical protein